MAQIPFPDAGQRPGAIPGLGSEQDNYRTLYFGNLHPFVNQAALQDLCTYFGPVEHVKLIKDKHTGQSLGYGFVKFMDRRSADMALMALRKKMYLGQELKVNRAFQGHQKEDTSTHHHVFVGDLGQEVTDEMLFEAFSQHGSCS